MTIGNNIDSFRGCRVENYDPKKGIQDPTGIAYKIGLDWDQHENGEKLGDHLKKLSQDPHAGELKNLVIGAWDLENGGPEELIQALVDTKNSFAALEGIFFGDITYEESEMSWIENAHNTPILYAYPNLKHFQTRGGNSLSLHGLHHSNLETLIIETGGLDAEVLPHILNAELPALKHLEIWLGSENYGCNITTEHLKPFTTLDQFPQLTYLGLCNSEMADDVAQLMATAPILSRLETLDLSKGVLSNKGAEALLTGTTLASLKKLDLSHHYVSSEVQAKFAELRSAGLVIDFSDQLEEEDYDDEVYRYIYVSE